MPKSYFEPTMYSSLSNKELLQKHEEIEIKISKAEVGMLSSDIVETMLEIEKNINKEIDDRLDDGRMSEDELEEDF